MVEDKACGRLNNPLNNGEWSEVLRSQLESRNLEMDILGGEPGQMLVLTIDDEEVRGPTGFPSVVVIRE